jgi:hypothetical protein
MIMENGNDDSRKKRDSTEVVEGDVIRNEEKTKKLRANKPTSGSSLPAAGASARPKSSTLQETNEGSDKASASALEDTSVESIAALTVDEINPGAAPVRHALDLEVALQRIVRMGDKDESKEFLSRNRWVNFRIGHAGDASALATCYRKSSCATNHNSDDSQQKDERKGGMNGSATEDTTLEVRLAEGLGDEDTPPSIFALLADVESDNSDERKLGAAALVSIAWEDVFRVLRVEWFYIVDDEGFQDVANLLERRMWLRLSALAMMTSCQMLVANGVSKTKAASSSDPVSTSSP